MTRSRQKIWSTVWLLLAALTLVTILTSIGPRYRQLAHVSPDADWINGQLRPFEGRALEQLGLTPAFYGAYFTVLESVGALALLLIGGVILIRRSDDPYAILFGLALANFGLFSSPLTTALQAENSTWALVIIFARHAAEGLLILALMVFPDGRFIPRWTRWGAGLWVLYLLVALFIPEFRLNPSLVFASSLQAAILLWAIFWMIVITILQIYRYVYVSDRAQRQQTKWVVYGLLFGLGTAALVSIISVGFQAIRQDPVEIIAVRFITFTIVLLMTIFMSACIGLAILRYRLWDIDLIIRRTLVYSSLTTTLAGSYFLLVILLEFIFRRIFGNTSQVAIALSTLAIAALFNPLRARIQAFIDRSFFRRKYSAEIALAGFADLARKDVDRDQILIKLGNVIEETVQPEKLSIWIREAQDRERLL